MRAREAAPAGQDRLWYVQMKRTPSIGPSQVRSIIEDATPQSEEIPWGFLLIAPANFSRDSQDAAQEVSNERGIREVYLWGRGELEDLLYLEPNRGILEKYFDIAGSNRDERAETYKRWLRLAENWGTWAYVQGATFPKFLEELHDVMAEIHLVAPAAVRAAVQNYIDHLDEELISTMGQAVGAATSLDEEAAAAGLAYARVMAPYRDAVLSAMRDDIGNIV